MAYDLAPVTEIKAYPHILPPRQSIPAHITSISHTCNTDQSLPTPPGVASGAAALPHTTQRCGSCNHGAVGAGGYRTQGCHAHTRLQMPAAQCTAIGSGCSNQNIHFVLCNSSVQKSRTRCLYITAGAGRKPPQSSGGDLKSTVCMYVQTAGYRTANIIQMCMCVCVSVCPKRKDHKFIQAAGIGVRSIEHN